ncbi:NF038129 family PEP-CTERM protein [Pseudoduganella chitinolytica]|uniref:NF038129 family PEP-CTERM protein n=1 Tax=Pseudoduganella chitinolytica TaxID=34070 RepID=A0ABY8BI94_9BURK|nr:NF038129 family PEP-CTERM protein [Pseudoduganella chitinolytica]WEF35655.1 NF038129 family PEP-CTERM protein [Pseudoduganella chitinolytica]
MSKHLPLARVVAALALALAGAHASADTTLNVSIRTDGFAASSGWLDLQFNGPGVGLAPAATVTLTDFVGFEPGAEVITEGQVGGSPAAGYTIGNGDFLNSLFHAVNYGSVLSFKVTFAGDADLSGDIGQSIFSVSAYAADQATLLGGSSALDGSLGTIAWTPATVVGGAGSTSFALNADAIAISPVPEPSSWLMMGIGAMLVAGAARRSRRA